ncbi:pentatricopeptide repeat-containing protein At2g44880-like [Aristolochia californica]|uniref:pentatricopeptide repeat-containing protein At2g44880-like n=1 Tax=Aristolochia californica TaxID=171875 RepID=UPI0035D5FCEF
MCTKLTSAIHDDTQVSIKMFKRLAENKMHRGKDLERKVTVLEEDGAASVLVNKFAHSKVVQALVSVLRNPKPKPRVWKSEVVEIGNLRAEKLHAKFLPDASFINIVTTIRHRKKVFMNNANEVIQVRNALLYLYATCGLVYCANLIIDEIPTKEAVSWNSIIGGYVKKGDLVFFQKIFDEKPEKNVLSWNSIIGCYVKKGDLVFAQKLFDEKPEKNVVSWNVMIAGYLNDRHPDHGLNLFREMGNLGALDLGEWVNGYMEDNGLKRRQLLTTSFVDKSAKYGQIDTARQLFDARTTRDVVAWSGYSQSNSIEPNVVVWSTVLVACQIHKNFEIGEESCRQLSRLYPGHSGDYILMSIIYASVGRWEDALKVKKHIKKRRIKKTPGCHMIEVDGVIHEFFAEDSDHSLSKDIYDTTEEML